MNAPQPLTRLRRTLISQKPERAQGWVALVGVLLLCLGSVIYWAEVPGWSERLAASRELVFARHEFWRLFTTLLVHGDLHHLLSNCLLFFILSYLLYGYFGARVFPLLSAVCGALTMALTLLTYDDKVVLIGASGMVYLMAGIWVALYLFIERRHTVRGRLVRTVGFTLGLLMPSVFDPVVSYRAHAIGFALGLPVGAAYFFARRTRIRAAEVSELLQPEDFEEDLTSTQQNGAALTPDAPKPLPEA
jgi:rhomboid protease GluP